MSYWVKESAISLTHLCTHSLTPAIFLLSIYYHIIFYLKEHQFNQSYTFFVYPQNYRNNSVTYCHLEMSLIMMMMMMMKWPPKVMRRSQRWNNFQIYSRQYSNTGGSDMWSNTLPLDHGGNESVRLKFICLISTFNYKFSVDKLCLKKVEWLVWN